MRIFLRYNYNDPRLVWNPAEYGGLTKVSSFFTNGPRKQFIYTPDMSLLQLFGKVNFEDVEKDSLKISSNGDVYVTRPGSISISHPFQLEEYPYDV